MKCHVCESDNCHIKEYYGSTNLWSLNLDDFQTFSFSTCQSCGFSANLSYSLSDVDFINYSNHTFSLDADPRETLLCDKILYYKTFLKYDLSFSHFIEIGAGKRLGLLYNLLKYSRSSIGIAIDPSYETKLVSQTKDQSGKAISISLKPSIKSFDFTLLKHPILILRNSSEYINPSDLKALFSSCFMTGGLLIMEFTGIDNKLNGSIFNYTECLNFYTQKSIDLVLSSCNLMFVPLESSMIHGDGRNLIIYQISPVSLNEHLIFFKNFSLLADYVNNASKMGTKFVMFGAGGRNIMAIYNELRKSISYVFDSDPSRVRTILPDSIPFIECGKVSPDSEIILLNHRFLPYARSKFPNHKLVMLNIQGQ